MTDAPIYLERHDRHATLILNRPTRRNALNAAMWAALPDLLEIVSGRKSQSRK